LNVSKAKNNFKQAQRDYDETMRTLASEIRQAMMELEASKSQWEQAQINVEYQQIANQANKRRYEDGTLSIIELQSSNNQLFSSEIELRNAYLRYQLKVREMNYYKGIPYVN
jgi:outer membrane protein